MTPFSIETQNDRILVTEKLENGARIQSTFNTEYLAKAFIEARQDMRKLGEAGAHKKWRDEEVKERRRLGLPADPLDIDEPEFVGWME